MLPSNPYIHIQTYHFLRLNNENLCVNAENFGSCDLNRCLMKFQYENKK